MNMYNVQTSPGKFELAAKYKHDFVITYDNRIFQLSRYPHSPCNATQWPQECTEEHNLDYVLMSVEEVVERLSPEGRLALFSKFCTSCGCVLDSTCHCWNDE